MDIVGLIAPSSIHVCNMQHQGFEERKIIDWHLNRLFFYFLPNKTISLILIYVNLLNAELCCFVLFFCVILVCKRKKNILLCPIKAEGFHDDKQQDFYQLK